MKNLDKITKKHKNIALIGHMGSGKSLIGRIIAKKLNIQHFDSDNLIEKLSKKKINEIFSLQGEIKFRKIEEKVILSLMGEKNIVLSLGGGSILSKKTRDFLKNDFITLFLDVNIKILVERLKNNIKRPLLIDVDIEKKIKQLDRIRKKYYLLADVIIDNNSKPEEIVEIFLSKYKKFKK